MTGIFRTDNFIIKNRTKEKDKSRKKSKQKFVPAKSGKKGGHRQIPELFFTVYVQKGKNMCH